MFQQLTSGTNFPGSRPHAPDGGKSIHVSHMYWQILFVQPRLHNELFVSIRFQLCDRISANQKHR